MFASLEAKALQIAAVPRLSPAPAAPRPADAAGDSIAHFVEHPPNHSLDDVQRQHLPPAAGFTRRRPRPNY